VKGIMDISALVWGAGREYGVEEEFVQFIT